MISRSNSAKTASIPATAHCLGARVMAAAHALYDGMGIPVRKVPAVVHALTGVEPTLGALTHDALRRGDGWHGLRAAAGGGPARAGGAHR
jgi:hypothetical protein